MAVAYLALGLFYWVCRRKLLAATFHPDTLDRPRLWDFLFYATFAIAITFSVAIAGVLMVFSTLVIPAAIALFFTNRFSHALGIAWLAGAAAAASGLLVSFGLDLATGPTLVVAFGGALVVAGLLKHFLRVEPGEMIVLDSSPTGG